MEGRLGFLFPGLMDPVREYGEMGRVNGGTESPEKYLQEFPHRASIPALAGTIGSVEDIDRIWRRDFPDGPDWRQVSDEWALPGYLDEIAVAADDRATRISYG